MTYNPTDPKLAWLRNLFMIRTTIRRRVAAQNEMSRLAIALERKAKLLDGGAAVDAFLAQSYREAAAMLREEFRALYPVSLKEYGKLLMEMAPYIDHFTTLEERCEALNVNLADRAGLTKNDGIIMIVFGHGLEDSAEHRHSDDNFDKPLFRALAPAFVDFMRSTPEGREAADRAFEDVFGDIFPLPGERKDVNPFNAPDASPTLH